MPNPVDPQIIPVAFSFQGGLQTKQDELQVQGPNLLEAENVRFNLLGQINKRPGFSPFSTIVQGGAEITQCLGLQVYNNELVLFDGQNIYTWLASTQQWLNRGNAFSVVNQQYSVVRNSETQSNPDGTSLDNLECYVWEDSRGGLRYSVMDSNTKAYIVSDQQLLDTGMSPKVIAAAALNQFVIYLLLSDTSLAQFTIGVNTPNVLSSLTTVFADGYNTVNYDATSYNGNTVVVYHNQANQLAVVYQELIYTTSLSPADAFINCIAITIDSLGILWIAYNVLTEETSNAIKVATFNLNTLDFQIVDRLAATEAVTDPVLNMTVVENPQAPGSILLCDEVSGTKQYVNEWILNADGYNINIVSGIPVFWKQSRGVGLASKAFIYQGNAFVNTIWSSFLQSTYFTHCLTSNFFNAPISKFNPQIGGSLRTNTLLAQCDVYNNQPGQFLVAAQRAGMFQNAGNTVFSTLGLNANLLNFAHANAFNSIVNANNLLITGGIVQSYDGTSVSESNFNLFPEGATFIINNTSPGAGILPDTSVTPTIKDGYFQYIFTYEWPDQNGLIQKSQPSVPLLDDGYSPPRSIFIGSNQTVTLTIPTYRLTAKQNPRDDVQIVVYRTQVNDTVFNKVASINNDVTVDSVTYTDAMTDVDIDGNVPGYWQSQLPNSAPPSCDLITSYANRVCISGLDDPNVLWFSQNRFDLSNYNTIPTEFSTLFTIGCLPFGDEGLDGITAIAQMDNNLIIYKDDAIFTTNSDGPQPTGTGDTFPVPTLVTSDTGCSDPNSIVFCPMGLLFKSAKGIYILMRDGSGVQYIGAPVEKYNKLTITSAQLLDRTNEVIFTTREGIILCWNYYFAQPQGLWSIWAHVQGVDSVMWQNQLVVAQANGVCLVQDNTNTVFSDNGRQVVLKVRLPWLGVGMQGWCMVYDMLLIGNFKGPHILQGVIEFNYSAGDVEQFAINSNMLTNQLGALPEFGDGIWGGGQGTPYQFQINLSRPMCQAMRVSFWDYQPPPGDPPYGDNNPPYNEAYTLNNIQFNIQPLGGFGRVPGSIKIGTKVSGQGQ